MAVQARAEVDLWTGPGRGARSSAARVEKRCVARTTKLVVFLHYKSVLYNGQTELYVADQQEPPRKLKISS